MKTYKEGERFKDENNKALYGTVKKDLKYCYEVELLMEKING